jgi:hypothetical protein
MPTLDATITMNENDIKVAIAEYCERRRFGTVRSGGVTITHHPAYPGEPGSYAYTNATVRIEMTPPLTTER